MRCSSPTRQSLESPRVHPAMHELHRAWRTLLRSSVSSGSRERSPSNSSPLIRFRFSTGSPRLAHSSTHSHQATMRALVSSSSARASSSRPRSVATWARASAASRQATTSPSSPLYPKLLNLREPLNLERREFLLPPLLCLAVTLLVAEIISFCTPPELGEELRELALEWPPDCRPRASRRARPARSDRVPGRSGGAHCGQPPRTIARSGQPHSMRVYGPVS